MNSIFAPLSRRCSRGVAERGSTSSGIFSKGHTQGTIVLPPGYPPDLQDAAVQNVLQQAPKHCRQSGQESANLPGSVSNAEVQWFMAFRFSR